MERADRRDHARGLRRRASARRLVLRAAALAICLATLLFATSATPPPGWEDPVTAVISPVSVETRPEQVTAFSVSLWPTARSWPTAPLDSLALHLEIPPGFHLVPASLRIGEGAPLSLPAASAREVALPSLSAREPVVVHWAIRGSSNLPPGRHLMEARVKRGESWVSANSLSFLEVLDSAVLAAAMVRGQVFRDLDASGTRDGSEEGLGGVLLWLDDAATTVTAPDGSFSFADVARGTHVVRMDAASLAGDPRAEGGPRRTLELTAGLPSWVEFAVSFPCDALAWSDRRLWGGYFLLERDDDRARYDFLRECPPPAGADWPAVARSSGLGADAARSGRQAPAHAAGGSPAGPSTARRAQRGGSARGSAGFEGAVEAGARSPSPGAAPGASARPPDLGSVTIEVGERLFQRSSDRLQPAYADLLGRLGTLLEEKGLSAELRTAAGDRRDAPPNPMLEERRRKAVETVLGDAVEGSGRRARRPGGDSGVPLMTLQGMSLQEAPDHSRLILTFSGEVPFASGLLPAAPTEGRGQPLFLLLVVHAELPRDFQLPDVARDSLLRRLSVDAVTEEESLLFLLEPAATITPRVRTLRNPFRLVVELPRGREGAAPSVDVGDSRPGEAAREAREG